MKISIHTFGCKLNQAESDELKKELIKAGHIIVPTNTNENVAVVRACAVTCAASQSARAMIRQLKKSGIYIIVVGCVENKDMKEIDFVAKDNEDVAQHIFSYCHPRVIPDQDPGSGRTPIPNTWIPVFTGMTDECKRDKKHDIIINRTRAFIKIQTGCNFNCSYCAIPHFRGKSQSIPVVQIIKKIKEAENDGYKEIILTGVNICHYNSDKINLSGLLEIILKKTKIPRIRLGSLDPRLITDKLIRLYNTKQFDNLAIHQFYTSRLLPHWHLSLQSGSDEILKSMNRLYTTEQYLKIICKVRTINPLFSFTTDVIVGFPGEDDTNFKNTCNLVKTAQFSKIHIFRYSPRPNTPACQMTNQISEKIKTDRASTLKKIGDTVAKNFAKQFVDKNVEVLFENKKSGVWSGYTPEYLQVKRHGNKNLQNKIISVKYQ